MKRVGTLMGSPVFTSPAVEGNEFWMIQSGLIKLDTSRVQDKIVMSAQNVCLWYDGTLRPALGHDATCEWVFDDQIWWHKPLKKLLTNPNDESTIKTNQGSNLPGKEQ